MSKLIFAVIFLIGITNISDITKINQLKDEAETAFKERNYRVAAARYRLLIDSFRVEDPAIMLNLGHCYFNLKDSGNAQSAYLNIPQNADNQIKSIAYMQLGNLKAWNQSIENYEQALGFFKKALKTSPDNEMARQNYETVKKLLDKLKQQQQQNQDKNKDQNQQQDKNQQQNQNNQNKNQQNQQQNQQNQNQKDQQKNAENKDKKDGKEQKDKQNQNQQEKDAESKKDKNKDQKDKQNAEPKGEQKGRDEKKQGSNLIPDRLKEVNLSQEQAKMLLEAMKNQEVQYLQQRPRNIQKNTDKSKPDW